MAIREDLVSSAITFLSDPKVQASPLAKRLAFLESKGLTQEEITEVLNRLNNPQTPSSSSSSPSTSSSTAPPLPSYSSYGNPYGQPPDPPGRDWRDWFIMAVVTSGVSYGLYTLAKRYIVPLMKPPTPPELEADKALVTAKFDEAQQILETLKADTAELRESQEKQRQQVEEALDSVEKAVSELKESGNRRDASIRSFKADIDSIRELIPKALERNKEAQTTQLQDLQNELKSLKSLLLNRTSQRSFTPGTGGLSSSASAPGLNANLPPNTNGTTNTTTEPLNAANMSGTDPTPSATAPSTSSPYLTNRPGIPAWQLAAREKAQNAGKAEEESTQTA